MALSQSLDHLILFVPVDPSTKLPQVPQFFQDNFTLTPGGFHADGITSNTLILLADGCYIELISFVDESKAPTHWWGPDAGFIGWKDWCLTNSLSPEDNWKARGGKDGSHAEPIKGGRKRADGVDVKWAVTFPKGETGGQDVRGRIPFFCHDITERNVRVPLSEEKTKHICSALGVHQLTVIVKDKALLAETRKVYNSMWDGEVVIRDEEIHFQTARVNNVKEIGDTSVVILRLPRNEEEAAKTQASGFWYGDVVLAAKTSSTKQPGTEERLDGGKEGMRGLYVRYM